MKHALFAMAAGLILAALARPEAVSAADVRDPQADFARRVLGSHDRERGRMGMPPLRWV